MQRIAVKQRTKILLAASALVVWTFFIFSPALQNGFLSWDDGGYVTVNPAIRELSPKAIAGIFSSYHHALYKPLTLFSFAVEYHFFKLDPFFYHLTNVLLHCINVLLVFWLIHGVGSKASVALLAALFFAIHPLRVESVTWIAERKDVLYALFFLLSLVMYLCYIKSKKRAYLVFSLASFVLSMLSKPVAVFLPCLLFALDGVTERAQGIFFLKEKIPFFLIALLFGVLNFIPMLGFIKNNEALSISLDSFFVSCRGVLAYLGKIFLPVKLSCFYPYPHKTSGFLPAIYYIAPLVVSVLCMAICWSRKFTRKIIFANSFFLLTLLPVLPLAPDAPGISMADRYTYMPSVGVAYFAGTFLVWLWRRARLGLKAGIVVSVTAGLAALSIATFQRHAVWKDDVALWSDALKYAPAITTAHLNLGSAFFKKGDFDTAQVHANEALRLDPLSWDVNLLAGNVMLARQRLDDAELFYQRALQLNARAGAAFLNLGTVYQRRKNYPAALEAYEKAISLDPKSYGGFNNLGILYVRLKQPERALENFYQAMRLDPEATEALHNIIDLFMSEGRPERSLEFFDRLLELTPSDAEVYLKCGIALAALRHFKEAEYFFKEALRFDPASVAAYKSLAFLARSQDRPKEAVLYLEKAGTIAPDDPEIQKELASLVARPSSNAAPVA